MEDLVNNMTTEQYFNLLDVAFGIVETEIRELTDEDLLKELSEL